MRSNDVDRKHANVTGARTLLRKNDDWDARRCHVHSVTYIF